MQLTSKIKKIIIFLIIIQFTSITLVALNNKIYSWDEATYIINGIDISNKPLSPIIRQYIEHERHPMLSWIIGFLFYLNIPLIFHNLLSPIFLFLFFLLTYKIGKKFYNKNVGLISAFILITIPIVVYISTKIMTDIPGALLFSLCLFFYYIGLKKPKYFLFGGFIGGISIIMRDMNLLLIPTLIVFSIIFYRKIKLRYFLPSILIGLFSSSPYLIDNYIRWGNPLYRIFKHINMVEQNVGYQNFPLQNISYSWVLFFPIYIGIPLFYLFVSNLYKNRKQISFDKRSKFLLIWFLVPFLVFILKQKIDERLILIFTIPVLIIGSKEVLSSTKKKFIIFILIILIFNNFLLNNFAVYNQIHLSSSHKDCFDYISNNIPYNKILHSNTNPPSIIAWYTNRTTIYSINPDVESNLDYYLYDKKHDKFVKKMYLNLNNYSLIFNNTSYDLYKKV